MTSRIDIAVDSQHRNAPQVLQMASRSRSVQIVDSLQAARAIVTESAEVASEAIQAGRNVLLLEPYRCSKEVRTQFAESGLVTPGHVARFDPSLSTVNRAMKDGTLGQLGLLRIHAWSSHLLMSSALYRELDIAVWIADTLPADVYAIGQMEYLQIHLGFESGAMALIDIDAGVPTDNSYYSLSAIGDRGAAHSDDHQNTQLLLQSGGPRALMHTAEDAGLPGLIDRFALDRIKEHDPREDWEQLEGVIRLADQVQTAARNEVVIHAETGND